MKKRIYISGALTSSGVPSENLAKAMRAAEAVFDMGASPLVPHFSIQYPPHIRDRDHAFWMSVDYPWVQCSDAVLRLPGPSKGADAEVAFAIEHGVPVFDSLETLGAWLAKWKPAESLAAEGQVDVFNQCCINKRPKPRSELQIARESLEKYGGRINGDLPEPSDKAPAGEKLIGKLRHFESGAKRSSDADGERYDLISPIGMRRLAETYAEGCGKYPPDPETYQQNWTKGMPVSSLLNHVLRHIYRYLGGAIGEDDLAHATWGLIAAMHMEELMPEMVDIYDRRRLNKRPVVVSTRAVRFTNEGWQDLPESDAPTDLATCAGHIA